MALETLQDISKADIAANDLARCCIALRKLSSGYTDYFCAVLHKLSRNWTSFLLRPCSKFGA